MSTSDEGKDAPGAEAKTEKKKAKQFGAKVKKKAAEGEEKKGEEDAGEGDENRKEFMTKGAKAGGYSEYMGWVTLVGFLSSIGIGYYKLRQPEFTVPIILNHLEAPGMTWLLTGMAYYLSFSGSSLEWREAMAKDGGVAKLVNYINTAEENPGDRKDMRRAGMHLLSLLAEYEETRPYLRYTNVFKTAAAFLRTKDLDIKGAALNVLVYMFQDKASATLAVESGVLALMCEIGNKAFEKRSPKKKEESETPSDMFEAAGFKEKDAPEEKEEGPSPVYLAGEMALQALAKVPLNYPGGVKAMMDKGAIGEPELNVIYSAIQMDMVQNEKIGNYDAALNGARQCINMSPQSPNMYAFCAKIQSIQGNIEGAIWNQRRAVKLGLRETRHRTFLSQLLIQSGRHDHIKEARNILSKMIKDKIDLSQRIANASGLTAPAIPAPKPEKKKENEPWTVGSFFAQGISGDAETTTSDSSKPESFLPGHPGKSSHSASSSAIALVQNDTLYSQLIKADILLRDYSAASSHVADWISSNPSSSAGHYSHAKILLHQGDFKKALEVLGHSLALNPRRAESQYLRAYLLYKDGQDDKALEICESVVKMLRRDHVSGSKVPNLHLLMGKLFEKKGEYARAQASYGMLIKYDSKRPMPHFRLSQALLKAGKKDEANKEIEQVLKLWRDACVPKKNCKWYFSKNQAAARALKTIEEYSKAQPSEQITDLFEGLKASE